MTRTTEQKARLQRVIGWLAAGAPHIKINDEIDLERFDYGRFLAYDRKQTAGPCKTVACIAGATCEFYWADKLQLKFVSENRRVIVRPAVISIKEEAAKLLGLNRTQKERLAADPDFAPLLEHRTYRKLFR